MKFGMRSKEISGMKGSMMVSSIGELGESIHLNNDVLKGQSGGWIIPIHKELKKLLIELYGQE